MTDAFRELAHSVYGYGWRAKLARETGYSYRTVRYWADGKHKPDKGVILWLALQPKKDPARNDVAGVEE